MMWTARNRMLRTMTKRKPPWNKGDEQNDYKRKALKACVGEILKLE